MYVHVSGGSDERNRDSPMSRGAEAEAEVLGSVEGVLVVLGHTPVSVSCFWRGVEQPVRASSYGMVFFGGACVGL
jgi:hypothetical protein